MKRKILFLAFVIGFLFANAQNFPFPVKYSDHYITTPIYDTLGIDFSLDRIYTQLTEGMFGNKENCADTFLDVYSINHWSSYNAEVPVGYAQPMTSDTILQIGGIAFIYGPLFLLYDYACDAYDTFTPFNNTGDSLFIIDENTLQVIYAQELHDSLPFYVNRTYDFLYEIVFDSAVSVQGNYLIAYKHAEDNVGSYWNNQNYEYRYPLTFYRSVCNNNTRLDCYGLHKKQIYLYCEQTGWMKYLDYKNYFNETEKITVIEAYPWHSLTNLNPDDKEFAHTTDLCFFVIPESVIDSEDLANRPVIEVDSTDTNFLSQIDLERMISVQPNPTKGEVVVSCPEPLREVALLNPMGQVLYRENYNQKQVTLDLSSYPQGVYILHLQTSSGKVRKKVVRQ